MYISAPGPSRRPVPAGNHGDRFYLGYRGPGTATVRLPAGGNVSAPHSDRALAEAVLRDRLHRAPRKALLDRFCHEWVRARGRGEFAWSVTAVDEWLASAASGKPRRRGTSDGRYAPARHRPGRTSQRLARDRSLGGGR